MKHPVAPGKEGYNLLSKRHLYRAVILTGVGDQKFKGPLVLEAKDGSYKFEHDLEEGTQDGGHVVFDFYLKDRNKEYLCYLADDKRKFKWKAVPKDLVSVEDTGKA
jgi:hypothetical protein